MAIEVLFQRGKLVFSKVLTTFVHLKFLRVITLTVNRSITDSNKHDFYVISFGRTSVIVTGHIGKCKTELIDSIQEVTHTNHILFGAFLKSHLYVQKVR